METPTERVRAAVAAGKGAGAKKAVAQAGSKAARAKQVFILLNVGGCVCVGWEGWVGGWVRCEGRELSGGKKAWARGHPGCFWA